MMALSVPSRPRVYARGRGTAKPCQRVGVRPHAKVNMDNVTHTLFALTLARTPLGRAGRGTTAALVIASNVPDLDIVGAARGGISYLAWHRGPTHGPLGIVGLGVATAGLVWIG